MRRLALECRDSGCQSDNADDSDIMTRSSSSCDQRNPKAVTGSDGDMAIGPGILIKTLRLEAVAYGKIN